VIVFAAAAAGQTTTGVGVSFSALALAALLTSLPFKSRLFIEIENAAAAEKSSWQHHKICKSCLCFTFNSFTLRRVKIKCENLPASSRTSPFLTPL